MQINVAVGADKFDERVAALMEAGEWRKNFFNISFAFGNTHDLVRGRPDNFNPHQWRMFFKLGDGDTDMIGVIKSVTYILP